MMSFFPIRHEDPETHESRWIFSVAGKEASQSFLLVGTVKEPKVGDLASLASLGEGRRSKVSWKHNWNVKVMTYMGDLQDPKMEVR